MKKGSKSIVFSKQVVFICFITRKTLDYGLRISLTHLTEVNFLEKVTASCSMLLKQFTLRSLIAFELGIESRLPFVRDPAPLP